MSHEDQDQTHICQQVNNLVKVQVGFLPTGHYGQVQTH